MFWKADYCEGIQSSPALQLTLYNDYFVRNFSKISKEP